MRCRAEIGYNDIFPQASNSRDIKPALVDPRRAYFAREMGIDWASTSLLFLLYFHTMSDTLPPRYW